MKNNILLLFFLLLLFSCKEEESPKPLEPVSQPVIVLNEGNFRSGNASISLFDAANNAIQNKVFQNNNQGRPLGDVAQSMIEHGGKAYVVVNNSNKIEVIDPSSFLSLGQITGLNSPRYILPVGGNKAYVSDLYQDELYSIDLQSLAITGRIATRGWTEKMIFTQGKAFVCHVDSNQLWVINPQNDSIEAKIATNISPNGLALDANGKLWVSCSGGINQGLPALHQINPQSYQLERTLLLNDISKSISSVQASPDGQKLYYLSSDLYQISIGDTALASSPLIPSNGRLFYSLGVHPLSGDIYLTDAVDYVQAGVLIRHNSAGAELHVARVGLIPGYIHFR